MKFIIRNNNSNNNASSSRNKTWIVKQMKSYWRRNSWKFIWMEVFHFVWWITFIYSNNFHIKRRNNMSHSAHCILFIMQCTYSHSKVYFSYFFCLEFVSAQQEWTMTITTHKIIVKTIATSKRNKKIHQNRTQIHKVIRNHRV